MPNNSAAPYAKRPTPADIAWRVSLVVVDVHTYETTVNTSTVVAGSAEQALERAKRAKGVSGYKVLRVVSVRSAAR